MTKVYAIVIGAGFMLIWAIFLLAIPVQAQGINLPKTVRVTNNTTGELVATVTVAGNHAYVRDKNGELIGTVVSNRDGTKTSFDPSGNIIAPIKLPD